MFGCKEQINLNEVLGHLLSCQKTCKNCVVATKTSQTAKTTKLHSPNKLTLK